MESPRVLVSPGRRGCSHGCALAGPAPCGSSWRWRGVCVSGRARYRCCVATALALSSWSVPGLRRARRALSGHLRPDRRVGDRWPRWGRTSRLLTVSTAAVSTKTGSPRDVTPKTGFMRVQCKSRAGSELPPPHRAALLKAEVRLPRAGGCAVAVRARVLAHTRLRLTRSGSGSSASRVTRWRDCHRARGRSLRASGGRLGGSTGAGAPCAKRGGSDGASGVLQPG